MICCVMMCGGKGTRLKKTMGLNIEKPMVKLKNKPLIEYLINILIQSNKFKRIFAAVSCNTQKTSEFVKLNYGDKITLMETSGRGYSEDYLKIIKYFKDLENEKKHYNIERILFLPIDVPLISLDILTQLTALNQQKPCLTIVLEKGFVKNTGIFPSSYGFTVGNKDYCYSGISIIDLKKTDVGISSTGKLTLMEEEYKILNRPEIACNANTLDDLKTAEKLLNEA